MESANLLADFFSSVFVEEPHLTVPSPTPHPHNNMLTDVTITPDIVESHLKQLSQKCSPGPDNVSAQVLKYCSTELSAPLAFIMSQSLLTSSLPPAWLKARVTPIFKKGNKTKADNYRPISLTSICCKIMERIICGKLTPYLIENGYISDNQHGFLPKRSTTTCLLHCLNKWTSQLDRNNPVDVIYLDFEKAFDRVPHRRLLAKMAGFGVGGKLRNWIEAFLSDRSFTVKVGSHYSTERAVKSGVPQGSVLGPILFLVYLSDLNDVIKSENEFFADDGKVYGNPLSSAQVLQADLSSIYEWTRTWLLPLNINKCCVLRLGKNNPHKMYNINNVNLSSTVRHNDLGVIITSDLSWSEHVHSIVNKANSLRYLILKTFETRDKELLRTLFITYVRPVLEYASVAWSPYLQKDIERIESVQRRYSKQISQIKELPYHSRLKTLNLVPLEVRRKVNDLVFVYKALTNKLGTDHSKMFKLNTDSRLRGHKLKLYHEKFKTKTRQFFLTNRVFCDWNGLDHEIVTVKNIQNFREKVSKIFC